MLSRFPYRPFIIASITILAFLVGCSPAERYRVLSVFFDGVPDPNKKEARPEIPPGFDTTRQADSARTRKTQEPKFFFHEPYRARECGDCHSTTGGNRLVMEQPDLCYQCHDDFSETYSHLHGPVAGGYCTGCHHPHMAEYPKMLKRKGQDLCLYCHEKSDVFANDVHDGIDDSDCTDCHDPHGGEDRFMIN